MRFALPTSILLCFLATQFPGYNAGVVPALFKCRTTECVDEFTGPVIADDLIRRAGGKPPPGSTQNDGGSGGTGGTGGTSESGGGTTQNEGTNTGETGSLGEGQETTGGFGAASGNGEGSSGGANNQYAPSVRNNYNKPATAEGSPTYSPPRVINVQEKVEWIRAMAAANGWQSGPWFFYSGFPKREESFHYMDLLTVTDKTGKYKSMDDIKPDVYDPDFHLYAGGPHENYFWASYSKAYAQAVQGKIYVITPESEPINQPYGTEKGSMLWSFEMPELTRNPAVTDITWATAKTGSELEETDPARVNPSRVIWNQGDEAIGFPGDPLYQEELPQEPLEI